MLVPYITGRIARALVDTGAFDKFMVDMMASRFKLDTHIDAGTIKAVNSKALKWLLEHLVRWDHSKRGRNFNQPPRWFWYREWNRVPQTGATTLSNFGCRLCSHSRDKPCMLPRSFSHICWKKLILALEFKKGVKYKEAKYVVVSIVMLGKCLHLEIEECSCLQGWPSLLCF